MNIKNGRNNRWEIKVQLFHEVFHFWLTLTMIGWIRNGNKRQLINIYLSRIQQRSQHVSEFMNSCIYNNMNLYESKYTESKNVLFYAKVFAGKCK